MKQLSERYLEDFAVGQTSGSGRLRIDGAHDLLRRFQSPKRYLEVDYKEWIVPAWLI